MTKQETVNNKLVQALGLLDDIVHLLLGEDNIMSNEEYLALMDINAAGKRLVAASERVLTDEEAVTN